MELLLANDVDAHEMIPSHYLEEAFGAPGKILGDLFAAADKLRPDPTDTNMHQPSAQDTMEIDEKVVWEQKGPKSPSAIDLSRRVEVLDIMGIERQLVFPTSAIAAMMVGGMDDIGFDARFGGDESMFNGISRPEFCSQFLNSYNDWALKQESNSGGRLRMVAVLPTYDDADKLYAEAKKLVDTGIKAVYIQADTPPGGVSPAHSVHDRMWKLFEDNDVAVTLHIGTEFFFLDVRWCVAETFAELFQSPELPNNNIQMFSTAHFAVENYLSTLVLGGVFERFPRLRVGLMEVGGSWVGPLARRMEMFVDVFPGSSAAKFSMRPTEYLQRNVRVSPFNFEPVDQYIKDNPFLADVYAYSTDYPHVEGTKNSKANMLARLEPLGEEVVKKFFTTNAEWLLP